MPMSLLQPVLYPSYEQVKREIPSNIEAIPVYR
jgi:hypothetical protein